MDPEQDWLHERMLRHRRVAVSGALDREAAGQITADLLRLDADGDEPVLLWLSGVTADLDPAFTLVDALELVRAPVHVTCVGTLTGAAIAVLAVADRRSAGSHAMLHLCDPPPDRAVAVDDVRAQARQHTRQLQRLHERIAAACRRPVEDIARDMRDGRLLTAEQARAYGLVDAACG